MSTDLDLPRILASSTVRAASPSVATLQRVSTRRRRRRTVAMVSVPVIALLAIAATVLSGPGPDGTELDTVDDGVGTDDEQTGPDPTPSTTTTSAPATSTPATPTPTPTSWVPSTSTIVDDALTVDAPAVLIPDGPWQLESLGSTGWNEPNDLVTVASAAGGLGPIAWVGFNAGLSTLDYEDGPIVFTDMTSPGGRTVRIGHDGRPDDLTAIFVVDGGSVAIGAFDITEAELLSIVDATTVAEGRPFVDTGGLPPGLTTVPTGQTETRLVTSYSLRRGTTVVSIRLERTAPASLDAFLSLRHRPNLTEVEIAGRQTTLASGDEATDEWPTAVFTIGSWRYTVEAPRFEPDTPLITDEVLVSIIDSLQPTAETELLAAGPWLQARYQVLDRWLGDIDLPPSVELDHLRVGPPIGIGEAAFYYDLLRCTLVLDWARTGDGARLDQVAGSTGWAVEADAFNHRETVLAARPDSADLPDVLPPHPIDPDELAQARAATSDEERWTTPLVESCAWVAPLTGQTLGP